jgi:hypothetical protein
MSIIERDVDDREMAKNLEVAARMEEEGRRDLLERG